MRSPPSQSSRASSQSAALVGGGAGKANTWQEGMRRRVVIRGCVGAGEGAGVSDSDVTRSFNGVSIATVACGASVGEGAFGHVYACRVTGCLITDGSTGQGSTGPFPGTGQGSIPHVTVTKAVSKAEATRLAAIASHPHPHVIALLAALPLSPSTSLVLMPRADADLLTHLVAASPPPSFPLPAACTYFLQMLSAVAHLHSHGIVHRDLKPENILLFNRNTVLRITDLGLSAPLIDGAFLKTSCGSPNYAAPEVVSGRSYSGPEVDVWSCGVVLYVMLCGKLPFDDEHIPSLFRKICGGIYHLPSHLPSQTRHLVAAMLQPDPLRRITIKEILQLDWFAANITPDLKPLFADRFLHKTSSPWNTSTLTTSTASPLLPPIPTLSTTYPSLTSTTSSFNSDKHRRRTRPKWHFGIRSKSPPLEIMLEIFRALKSCSMTWRPPYDPFILSVSTTITTSSSSSAPPLEFQLQLYRVHGGDTFLLDFRNLSPEIRGSGYELPFVEACCRIIRELAVGG